MVAKKRVGRKRGRDRLLKGVYQPIPQWSPAEIEAALARGSVDAFQLVALSVSLYGADLEWAEGVCLTLARHDNPVVRGNAMLGFGHLARRFGALSKPADVRSLLEAGLRDEHEHVQGPADDAMDDMNQFLGWTIQRPYGSA